MTTAMKDPTRTLDQTAPDEEWVPDLRLTYRFRGRVERDVLLMLCPTQLSYVRIGYTREEHDDWSSTAGEGTVCLAWALEQRDVGEVWTYHGLPVEVTAVAVEGAHSADLDA